MLRNDKRGGLLDYKEGDILGENKHTFIKEVEPNVYKMRGYNRNVRRALFKCGLCGSEFENTIQLIKSSKVRSCGCLQKKSVKKYFEEKRNDKN